jgi:hypothetical protein
MTRDWEIVLEKADELENALKKVRGKYRDLSDEDLHFLKVRFSWLESLVVGTTYRVLVDITAERERWR